VSKPLFSILHPSVRPRQWRRIRENWIGNAARPDLIEYLLCFHEAQQADFFPVPSNPQFPAAFQVCINRKGNHPTLNGRSSLVDNVNLLADHSHGAVLIVTADDQEAPPRWDEELGATILAHESTPAMGDPEAPAYVVQVSTATPNDTHRPELMTLQILSRERWKRFGYVFHPSYSGMYADQEFSELAYRDRVVIDARELVFPHHHPKFDPAVPTDEWYKAANSTDEYARGGRLYHVRKALDFPPDPEWRLLSER